MKTTNSSSRRLVTASTAALCACIFFPAHVHAAALAYTVTDLGTLGGSGSTGFGINASGQVAGSTGLTGDSADHAARWTGTTPTVLFPAGGTNSTGIAINASGQVAGTSDIAGNGATHAVRWTGTTPQDLGTVGGTNSYAYGINASGQVAGWSESAPFGIPHAVRWTGTVATDLGLLGPDFSKAFAINDAGQVAGDMHFTFNGPTHAARWTGNTVMELGTLGGSNSFGRAINASGQVAGFSNLPGNSIVHASLWTGAATTPTDLGSLPGFDLSEAVAINAPGDVLGLCYNGDPSGSIPFLYVGGTMYDLRSLLVPGSGATAVNVVGFGFGGNALNDLGQIAAYGTIGGQVHALRLDPVAAPEPASAVLLLGSATAFLARRRRSTAGV